jgi:hypothetical protein
MSSPTQSPKYIPGTRQQNHSARINTWSWTAKEEKKPKELGYEGHIKEKNYRSRI